MPSTSYLPSQSDSPSESISPSIAPTMLPSIVPSDLPNIALNKPAIQSTTVHGGVASRAVDGNTSGYWSDNSVTHTGGNGWWIVNLGVVASIDRVVLYNRLDYWSHCLNNAKVSVLDYNEAEVYSLQLNENSPVSVEIDCQGI